MASLLESITQQLGGNVLKQMSGALGTDERATGGAVTAAVPMLLRALARNASKDDGARALNNALAKDHDGSILDNLGAFLGNAQAGPGDGILKHVLGSQRPTVEAGLSRSTGLDAGSMGKLMTMLAPVVLGQLGRQQRQSNLDASGIANMLSQEKQELERRSPEAHGMIGALLDADGDGDVDMGDIAKKGLGFLGKLMGGR